MSALFITGAGTDVGKTFVTAGLIRHLRGRGQAVDALKPIVSGFDPVAPSGSDPAILLEALGRSVTDKELARISPWRFRAPLSPDMAASAEGRTMDPQGVIRFCQAAITAADGVLLIEGVGGVMVPLDDRCTTLDVMARLGLPLIFVGGSYLGAISHILSGIDVLLHRGLELRAVAISETPASTVALDATMATLGHFVKSPLLALRRHGEAAENEAVFARLAALL
ncbi:dethiobiotin synthase [Methylocapsa polymorpha]|uniref:ATP-dependent dethiobiotin synthetase BioD n=1 Tax=Methylocapsa polymorpha TaxID=3080828 RepID=A0ABZ0HSU8_9HYPH|nr:dethiobiotin synthase [Methylocapsa sp. RX1]